VGTSELWSIPMRLMSITRLNPPKFDSQTVTVAAYVKSELAVKLHKLVQARPVALVGINR
jgi:hypothetical protein